MHILLCRLPSWNRHPDFSREPIYQRNGVYYNHYNAKGGPEQIGMATSSNLLDWTRYPGNPVLRVRPGGYDSAFVADGKVFRDGDHWTMFYFGVGNGGAHIMIAFSYDLIAVGNMGRGIGLITSKPLGK